MNGNEFLRGFQVWCTNFYGAQSPWVVVQNDQGEWGFLFLESSDDPATLTLDGKDDALELKLAAAADRGGTWTVPLSIAGATHGDFVMRLLECFELLTRRMDVEIDELGTFEHHIFLASWLCRLGEYFRQPKYEALGHVEISVMLGRRHANVSSIAAVDRAASTWLRSGRRDPEFEVGLLNVLDEELWKLQADFDETSFLEKPKARLELTQELSTSLALAVGCSSDPSNEARLNIRLYEGVVLALETSSVGEMTIEHELVDLPKAVVNLAAQKSISGALQLLQETILLQLLEAHDALKTRAAQGDLSWVNVLMLRERDRNRPDFVAEPPIDYMAASYAVVAAKLIATIATRQRAGVKADTSAFENTVMRMASMFPDSSIPSGLVYRAVNTFWNELESTDAAALAEHSIYGATSPSESVKDQISHDDKVLASEANWSAYAQLFNEHAVQERIREINDFFSSPPE